MKKFFFTIFTGVFIGAFILLLLTSIRMYKFRNNINYTLSKNIHTVFIGPSTIQCAINDKMLEGSINLGRSGTNYTSFTPVLEKILDNNPQVDTVFLTHGIFMVMAYDDESIQAEPLQYVHSHFPFVTIAPWQDYKDIYMKNINFYSALLTPPIKELFSRTQTLKDIQFGYSASEKRNLNKRDAEWSISWRDNRFVEQGSNRDLYSIDYIKAHYTYNLNHINSAIEICRKNNVVPILFFPPLYQINRWVNDEGFREYMKQLDGSLLVADYQNFEFPNDDYYQDVYHLNADGARFLTSNIADKGYNVELLSEWIKY